MAKKVKINLYSTTFSGNSVIEGKTPTKIEYERKGSTNFKGTTIFTDEKIFDGSVDRVSSTKKVAWITKSKSTDADYYTTKSWSRNLDRKFDAILTYDKTLLSDFRNAHRIPLGGVTVNRARTFKLKGFGRADNPNLKLISMLYSSNNTTDGQKLRHTLSPKLPYLDRYGTGASKPVSNRDEALYDYLFSVCIEKSQEDNQFSEELLDAFATSTVPIYWGPKNVSTYFDIRGMIILDNPDNLDKVVHSLNTTYRQEYESRKLYIAANKTAAEAYGVTDDWIYDNILKNL